MLPIEEVAKLLLQNYIILILLVLLLLVGFKIILKIITVPYKVSISLDAWGLSIIPCGSRVQLKYKSRHNN